MKREGGREGGRHPLHTTSSCAEEKKKGDSRIPPQRGKRGEKTLAYFAYRASTLGERGCCDRGERKAWHFIFFFGFLTRAERGEHSRKKERGSHYHLLVMTPVKKGK